MNLAKRTERDEKLIRFLTTPNEIDEKGKPIYPTLFEAGLKFNLSLHHVWRIKKKMGVVNGREKRRKD